MAEKQGHSADRSETKATKGAERERAAQEAWAEIHDASRAHDERTERLKAARLARLAGQDG
ncbi:hypothetical protein [Methylobacterium sp. V23]|uniref:hypothetical protein n=1 Tax=Methylobacterium sp. V23 TaxID=2044878 RepID=UPI000CDA7724|nr:hypothetical protein [Methylobacterium sp. V23]POR40516.1 hypothetical protein CRT23_23475 [Methylobacterium sp. V23]